MRNLLLLCAATASLTACSLERLTGAKPHAKDCTSPTIRLGADTLRMGDTLLVPVYDADGQLAGHLTVIVREDGRPCS